MLIMLIVSMILVGVCVITLITGSAKKAALEDRLRMADPEDHVTIASLDFAVQTETVAAKASKALIILGLLLMAFSFASFFFQ